MAKVDITIPGERIVESFTALVPQPTAPSTARAPDVGLVELSYVNPTVLVPGPPGPPGPAGSRWYTGVGDPTTPGTNFGDMYLNDTDGTIWTWNGTAWVDTGTDLSPDASELLIKIKTVDGSGSGLDADTLDGHDSTYFATDADMTAAENNLASINAEQITQNNRLSSIETVNVTQDNRLSSVESKNVSQDSAIALKADINSPTFTGDPKAPTPAAADNDTSIATTAFVKTTVNTAVGGIVPFPEAPVDGLTYGRKNAAWATIVGGALISDTAPPSPQPGQMWFESDSGNTFIWYSDPNTSQWVQVNVMPPTAQVLPPVGSVIDSVMGTYAANADITTIIPADDTIPQVGEGTQIISVTITPKSITNKLRCRFTGQGSAGQVTPVTVALFVNGAANAVAARSATCASAAHTMTVAMEHEFVPAATTLQTLTLRAGPGTTATIRFNGSTATRYYGGVNMSTLVVEEIVA